LGRLFGLQSLVQSNILFTDGEVLGKYPEVLDLLFEVAQKKPWLMESSTWTIASSVLRWPAATASKAAEITYQRLVESGMAKTGEGVGIWLALQTHQPNVTPPRDVWSTGSPLIIANLATLAKVLKESGSKDAEGAKSKGSWNPKLGFVWESVLNVYFSDDEAWKSIREGKHAISEWAEFWRVVVDGELHDLPTPLYAPQSFAYFQAGCCESSSEGYPAVAYGLAVYWTQWKIDQCHLHPDLSP
jgi:DNA polymerase phi